MNVQVDFDLPSKGCNGCEHFEAVIEHKQVPSGNLIDGTVWKRVMTCKNARFCEYVISRAKR